MVPEVDAAGLVAEVGDLVPSTAPYFLLSRGSPRPFGPHGLGAGAAVTWAATPAHPEAPAVLLASDDGRPAYERMGYVPVERWTARLRPASGS